MSKDIIFHSEGKITNPTCVLADGSTKTYVSLNLHKDNVLVKNILANKKDYVCGVIIGQVHKNRVWYYKVQTVRFIKWCGPTEFKVQ